MVARSLESLAIKGFLAKSGDIFEDQVVLVLEQCQTKPFTGNLCFLRFSDSPTLHYCLPAPVPPSQAKSDSLQLAKAMDLSKVMDQALEESNKARLDLERELEAAKKTIGDLQTQLDEAKASVSAPPSQNHPVSTRDETTLSYPTKDDSSSQNSASVSPSASASASISDPPPNPVEQNVSVS